MKTTSQNKTAIVTFLKTLRDTIVEAFEAFEPNSRFQKEGWDHHGGGGGEISMIRGNVFEKGAVNWSGVYGKTLPFREEQTPFFATGISLITHMMNPFMPTVHMNIRYIETEKEWWFGGGYDLTPMGFENKEDTTFFHNVAKSALGYELYQEFSKNASNYFFIPHWNTERGVGGIFFDHYNTGNFEADYALWKKVGSSFLKAIIPIYKRREKSAFSLEDKIKQNQMRSRYVEFNLLYDRGTKFGFLSKGNPKAILCSMPPTATW